MTASDQPGIFVQIASYRDPECQQTISDLFHQAKYPDRINVGLCWQYLEGEDPNLVQVDRPNQVRQLSIPVNLCKGCCWARGQTQQLLKDEPFTLQIDSHMRFVKDWDVRIVNMLEKLRMQGVSKPILSHMPPGYDLNGVRDDWFPTGLRGKFDEHGILVVKLLGKEPLNHAPPEPKLGAFIVAGFFFARSEVIKEVPYDPHLYFLGEEATLSVRLWTRGWDIYHPNEVLVYHLYRSSISASEKPKKFSSDHVNASTLDRRSRMRVRQMLSRVVSPDVEAALEIQKYGLGHDRTLRMYEEYAGVDFKRRTYRTHSILGIFDSTLAPEFDPNRFSIFKSRYERGIPFSNSAPWPVDNVIPRLMRIVKELSIEKIIDAPCGDSVLGLRLSGIFYHGLDIIKPLIGSLAEFSSGDPKKNYSALDITRDPLPSGDLLISRDFMTRVSNQVIWDFLLNVRTSSIHYLLADHEPCEKNPDDGGIVGCRRPVNLCASPFYLPQPILCIPDGPPNHFLGLWDLKNISFYLRPVQPSMAALRSTMVPALEYDTSLIESAFIDRPDLFAHLLKSFFLGCTANKEFLVGQAEILKKLQTPFKLPMKARNNLFKLIYIDREMQLTDYYPPIDATNEISARILARDFLQWQLESIETETPLSSVI